MKIVCDFDAVSAVGKDLVQSSSDMKSATTDCVTKFASSLSGWKSNAKTMLEGQFKGQAENALNKAQYTNEFGEFITTTAESLLKLEDDLANLNI